MKKISDSLQNKLKGGKMPRSEEKPPIHELDATILLIERDIGFTREYARGYWSYWLKKKNISYTKILGLIKDVQSVPKKKRGGALFNKIK